MFSDGPLIPVEMLIWAMEETGSTDLEQRRRWADFRSRRQVGEAPVLRPLVMVIAAPGSSQRPIMLDPKLEVVMEEDLVVMGKKK